MEGQKYRVILKAPLIEASELNKVRTNLARLFNVDEQKIAKLLTDKPVVIKRGLNLSTAKTYKAAVQKAGADCIIDSESPPIQQHRTKAGSIAPVSESQILKLNKAHKSFSFLPIPSPFISADADGINLNRANLKRVGFENIQAFSVLSEIKKTGTAYRIVLFIAGYKRPYIVDAAKIRYSHFADCQAAGVLESLKKFLLFLLSKNNEIFFDEHTEAFIKGQRPLKVKETNLLTHITSIGNAIAVVAGRP